MRWDGSAWNAVDSPTTTALRDVGMVTPNDGWAVGGEDAGRVIVRWDGSAWSTVLDDPNSPGLETIAMTSVSDGWAAGQDGTLLHWDAIQWTPALSPVDATLHALAITSSASGWAVGDTASFCGTPAGASFEKVSASRSALAAVSSKAKIERAKCHRP